MGRKLGRGLHPLFGQQELGLHLTQSRLVWDLPPYQGYLNPSSHLATTDMNQKLGGAEPLWGRRSWVPIQHNVARDEAYLHAWPQYTNITDKTDKQTGQRSDNTGRTILQTVVQKRGQSNLTYKAALPLHMNGSVIFARWCQCAPKNRKPTMVAMETSLRTSKLAMTSSDSLTPKTHL